MKTKSLVLLMFLIFPFQLIIGQDTIVVYGERKNSRADIREEKIEARKLFVQKYVDSLNNYKVSDKCELPSFFTTSNFDFKYGSQFMFGLHGRISLRKLIIDKLINYELMLCVMDSEDNRLQIKYKGKSKRFYVDFSKIPFEQFSTFELIDLRLDQLENLQSLGEKEN